MSIEAGWEKAQGGVDAHAMLQSYQGLEKEGVKAISNKQ